MDADKVLALAGRVDGPWQCCTMVFTKERPSSTFALKADEVLATLQRGFAPIVMDKGPGQIAAIFDVLGAEFNWPVVVCIIKRKHAADWRNLDAATAARMIDRCVNDPRLRTLAARQQQEGLPMTDLDELQSGVDRLQAWLDAEDATHFGAHEKDIDAVLQGIVALRAERDALESYVVNACEMPEVAAMRYIDQLRADKGDSVIILSENPGDLDSSYRTAIDCNGAWTDWRDRRFTGESVIQCLAKAVTARAALAKDAPDVG